MTLADPSQNAACIRDLLAAESADPACGASLVQLILRSDPVADSARLELIRQVLQEELQADREDPRSEAWRAIARLALRTVAEHRSPIAADLDRYLGQGPPDVSPAAVRAAAMLSSFRGLEDLARALDADDRLSSGLATLVSLGILIAQGDDDGHGCIYSLTPAGRPALSKLAAQVVEFELGRFPWPSDVPNPNAWAQAKGQEVFPFERRGMDYAVVAKCIGNTQEPVGSLSLRRLFGLAKPAEEPRPAAEPQPTPEIQTLALLSRDLGEIEARMKAIIDEHLCVEEVVDGNASVSLAVFASETVREEHEADVIEICSDSGVACAFAA